MTKRIPAAALGLALALSILIPAGLQARARAAANTESSDSDNGGGKFGIGAAIIPLTFGNLPGISADYWLSSKLAVEGFLGLDFGSEYINSTDSAGQPVNDGTSDFGIAASARYFMMEADDVHFGFMGRMSYATGSDTAYTLGVAHTTSGGTFGLFIGPDVEAFIPMWKSISVEASTGLNILLNSNDYGANSLGSSSVFLGGGNSIPLNVAFHYYFN